ncbi:MAG: acyltransferase [bacterium]|nr:acyltransferase [bacterium]
MKTLIARKLVTLIRYLEGTSFLRLRRFCYRKLLKKMGRPVSIGTAVFIMEPEEIEIGNNVSIHEFCVISGFGGVKIGNDVSIATGTKIFSSTHPFDDKEVKIREGVLQKLPVEIGDNVWVGANVVITPGVKVGSGVVIGAGAVVTKDLEKNGVYAGVPALLIKKRFSQEK